MTQHSRLFFWALSTVVNCTGGEIWLITWVGHMLAFLSFYIVQITSGPTQSLV